MNNQVLVLSDIRHQWSRNAVSSGHGCSKVVPDPESNPYKVCFSPITVFLVTLLLVAPVTGFADQFPEFGESAERIEFDDLPAGAPIKLQLTMSGIVFLSSSEEAVKLVDRSTFPGQGEPLSPPYSISSVVPGKPIELAFLSPRKRVGMTFYIGHIKEPVIAGVTAYNENGDRVAESFIDVSSARESGAMWIPIGIESESQNIERVIFDFERSDAARIFDDLLVEPSQDDIVEISEFEEALQSPEVSQVQKLEVIDAVQRMPSRNTSLLLQRIALEDQDMYLRERAVSALINLRDPNAIAPLVDLASSAPISNLKVAAYNAVWALRKTFPAGPLPEITLRAMDTPNPGDVFRVEAIVRSSVDQPHAQIWFVSNKHVRKRPGEEPLRYEGPLSADEPVRIQGQFLMRQEGFGMITAKIRVDPNLVEGVTAEKTLFLDFGENGIGVSLDRFAGSERERKHFIPVK